MKSMKTNPSWTQLLILIHKGKDKIIPSNVVSIPKRLVRFKPIETPINPNVKLYVDQWELLSNPERYCHLFGKLKYRIITCPNIFFAVSVVSQNMETPHLPH